MNTANQTLRDWLLARGNSLDSPELTGPGADQDYEEVITREWKAGDGSRLVVAGDSAVISTPSACWSFPADEVEGFIEETDDWERVES